MAYIELTFSLLNNESVLEILSARLSMLGFDSFFEDEEGFRAYCPEENLNLPEIESLMLEPIFSEIKLLSFKPLEDKNWNEIWESSYEPVLIDDRCFIRAPFHNKKDVEFDIVIEPKMSFGTAHHETTAQMIGWVLKTDLHGRSLLDMGCGTAVLAILARLKGADPVIAIDNDIWAYNNSCENVILNQTADIKVVMGDANSIGNQTFEVILANINRNILLNDMHVYASALNLKGLLFLSGFYESDLESIRQTATQNGLTYLDHSVKNQWVAAKFCK
jgi:ribosomal protein L11 methyltransferase